MGVLIVECNVDVYKSNFGGTVATGWIDDDKMSGI